MARTKEMPQSGVVLSGVEIFRQTFKEFDGDLISFEQTLIDQIEVEVKAYWSEIIAESKRKKVNSVTGTDKRLQMEKTFIYFDPKLQKVKRGEKVNHYIYWRKARFAFFKSENQKVRRGETIKAAKKASTTTVAQYDLKQFKLPAVAEWQLDIIERYEKKFFVLRQLLKYVQLLSTSFKSAGKSFGFETDLNDLNDHQKTSAKSDDDNDQKFDDLTQLAERLQSLGNDPDKLESSEIDLLFNTEESLLQAAGINPVIKKIYTGANHT